jgi:hypothetical protein
VFANLPLRGRTLHDSEGQEKGKKKLETTETAFGALLLPTPDQVHNGPDMQKTQTP